LGAKHQDHERHHAKETATHLDILTVGIEECRVVPIGMAHLRKKGPNFITYYNVAAVRKIPDFAVNANPYVLPRIIVDDDRAIRIDDVCRNSRHYEEGVESFDRIRDVVVLHEMTSDSTVIEDIVDTHGDSSMACGEFHIAAERASDLQINRVTDEMRAMILAWCHEPGVAKKIRPLTFEIL
jgi:hypothetical protein